MIDKTKHKILIFDFQSTSVLKAERYFCNFQNAVIVKFHSPLIKGCPPTEVFEYKQNKLIRKLNLGYSGRSLLPLLKVSKLFYLLADFVNSLQCIYAAISSTIRKYDICISLCITHALAAMPLKKIGMVRYNIFHLTDYYVAENKKGSLANVLIDNLYKKLLKWVIKNCDALWVVSPHVLNTPYLRRILSKTKKTVYVLETVGCDNLDSAFISQLEANRENSWVRNIAFLGNLNPHQGIELILKILPDIIEIIPDVSVRIIGSGPEENNLKSIVKAKGLEKNVIFFGYVGDRNKIYRLLSDCAIGLAMYKPLSQFGLNQYISPAKIREYMVVGLPIIITEEPYFAGVIKKNTAGFVIAYDSKQLFKVLIDFLQNEKRINQYRQNILRLAEKYKYDALMDKAMKYTLNSWYNK